ncbi:MAG: ribonuclease H-like domain-containing protein [Rectinema sp.]|nr:ribonuclease H-like domain-containing protein [Rectinema sp.]
MNLKERLALLKTAREVTHTREKEDNPQRPGTIQRTRGNARVLRSAGWDEIAPLVWRREIERRLPFLGRAMQRAIPEMSPGEPGDTVYFDLETTGLSGGTGTIPFLCASGKVVGSVLVLRQVYLEDYPGEPDFLNAVIDDLSRAGSIVSYNGACFDVPLLQTRCILNHTSLPLFTHHDLLRDCRRLWRRTLESCSLQYLESMLLDKVRENDIPGFLVPRVWLEAVRATHLSEAQEELIARVWYHNGEDVVSLAGLHRVIIQAYREPEWAVEELRADPSALCRILAREGREREARDVLIRVRDGEIGSWLDATARMRALRHLAAWAWRTRDRDLLGATVCAMDESPDGCIARAKYYEHQACDFHEALYWAEKARDELNTQSGEGHRRDLEPEALEHRIIRLQKKIARQGSI